MHGAPAGDNEEYAPSKVFANLFISFVGAGVLGLPYAFSQSGVVLGILVMVAVFLISTKAMMMVVQCKSKLKAGMVSGEKFPRQPVNIDEPDYGDLALVAFGPAGWWLIQGAIVSSQIGFCCAYVIFIRENMHTLFPQISVNAFFVASLLPQALLVLIRDLKGLSVFSLLADVANIFAFLVVFWFDFKTIEDEEITAKAFKWDGLPFILGVAIYCYEGAGMILSLEQSVPSDHRDKFPRLLTMALASITLLYVVFGSCGYASFGENTEKIITLNMPPGILPNLVKGCLCFSLLFTLPVMMFPVSTILEKQLSKGGGLSPIKGNVMRIGLVAVAAVVTVLIPDFSNVMAFIGSTCCNLLALICPPALHLFYFKSSQTRTRRLGNYALMALGIVSMIVGLADVLERIMNPNGAGDSIHGV